MVREKQKTSFAKYSIEFNDFAKLQRPHWKPYFRLAYMLHYVVCVQWSKDWTITWVKPSSIVLGQILID